MLKPNRVLCMIVLIAGYQLVTVIRHFWLTQVTSEPGLSRVAAPETAITGDHTEE
ncbi:TPA: type II secretion system protein GspC, partial [Escherichia coli]